MIKVNLLYDVAAGAGSKKQKMSFSAADMTNALGGTENAEIAMRLGVFAVPIILALSFKWFTGVKLESDYKMLQQEQAALQAKLKGLDPAIKEVEKFQEERHKLESQLQAIRTLSKERLKNVKSLDMLQGIIPAKAWLTSLKIVDKNMEMDGMATDDLVVSDFMQGLQQSIYFSNVKLVNSEEFMRKDGSTKKFRITCSLENL